MTEKPEASDIVAITETWLTPDDDDCLFMCKASHHIFRQDRKDGAHGGVALLLNNRLKANQCRFDYVKELEYVCVRTVTKTRIVYLCVVYKPSCDRHSHLIEDMDQLLQALETTGHPYLLLGDFNLPDIDWTVPTCLNNRGKQNQFLEMFLSYGITQKVLVPTRKKNTLDLIFESQEGLVIECLTDAALATGCDHDIVRFNANINVCFCNEELFDDWNNADYSGMKVMLDTISWRALFQNCSSVNDKWCVFKTVMQDMFNVFVPKRSNKSTPKRQSFPKEIQKLLIKKRAAHRKLRSSSNPSKGLEDKCYQLNKRCTDAILAHYRKKETNVLKDGSLKRFFNYVKRTLKTPEQAVCLSVNGEIISSDDAIAETFNDQFSSVFVLDDGNVPQMDHIMTDNYSEINDVFFSKHAICSVLRSMKASSSTGLDDIPSVCLKNISEQLAVPLQSIFQDSFDTGVLPDDWLKAKVRPIYKKGGSRSAAANYRPISLTSVSCRVMERVLKGFLLDHLSKNNIITASQHGFMAKKSTETQLLECINDWTSSLDSQENTDVFYMDIAKAFDVVSHPKLLYKLKMYKITGKFYAWIDSFLKDRSQCVKVGNSLSCERNVLSGVPQGSVLGPVLFLLFINDLPSAVKESTVKIFADDTKIYLSRKKGLTFDALYEDIESVLNWTAENQLGVAFHKSNILHVGHGNPLVEYVFNDTFIPCVDVVKDLGVYVSNDMKFSVHIDKIVAKAHRMCGLIFKCFTCRDHDFLVQMFKTYVLPLLEYCSTVWSPQGLENIKKIERVQRRFTKRFPGLEETVYLDRLKQLSLERLELRRIRSDLVMTFNIVKRLNGLSFDDFFKSSPNERVSRNISRNSLFLEVPKRCLNVRAHSFAVRSVKFWNFLNDKQVLAPSTESFKERLKQMDLESLCLVADF